MRDLHIPVLGERRRPKVFTSAPWTTEHELAFIDGLGSHSENVQARFDRRTLLENYVGALPKRVNWGAMNADRVRAHAAAALKREQQQGAILRYSA